MSHSLLNSSEIDLIFERVEFESILIFEHLYESNISHSLFAHLECQIILNSLIHTWYKFVDPYSYIVSNIIDLFNI